MDGIRCCGKERIHRYSEIIHETLGESLCNALPGFHAITGCDYNPSFYRKGKKRPLTILRQSDEYRKAFSDLGENNVNIDAVFKKLETFVCHLYNIIKKKKK